MQTTLSLLCKVFPALGLFLSLATLSSAQAGRAAQTEPPLNVRYAGVQNNLLVFDVRLATVPQKTVLRILDGEGNVLHRESVKSSSFHRRYLVVRDNARQVKFEVSTPDTLLHRSYDIAVHLEEKWVVTATR